MREKGDPVVRVAIDHADAHFDMLAGL
jgi:hypothetical protein